MNDEERPEEPDWDAYRKAYREKLGRRFSAGVALVIAVVGVFVIVVKVLAPQDYPAGDIRNELVFRLALSGFFFALICFAVVGTQRALRQNQ